MAGCVLGAALLTLLIPGVTAGMGAAAPGVWAPVAGLSKAAIFGWECLMTAFLCIVVYGSAVAKVSQQLWGRQVGKGGKVPYSGGVAPWVTLSMQPLPPLLLLLQHCMHVVRIMQQELVQRERCLPLRPITTTSSLQIVLRLWWLLLPCSVAEHHSLRCASYLISCHCCTLLSQLETVLCQFALAVRAIRTSLCHLTPSLPSHSSHACSPLALPSPTTPFPPRSPVQGIWPPWASA